MRELDSRSNLGLLLNDRQLLGPGAEVGVYRGEFAEQILSQWCGSCLYLVDPWSFQSDYLDSWRASNEEMESFYQLTIERLKKYQARTQILRMRSELAAT